MLNTAVDNDGAVNIFESLFCDSWDLHVPLKKHLIRSTNVKHWLNDNLRKAYHQRDMLYKWFCQTCTSATWMMYHQARNHCTAITRTAKRAFFLSICDKPHLVWNKLKECTGLGKLHESSVLAKQYPNYKQSIC